MSNLISFSSSRRGIVWAGIFIGVPAKKAMDKIGKGTIKVPVDTVTSEENGPRLACSSAYQVRVKENQGEFLLKLVKA
jgi:hypothetical protein